MVKTFQLSQDTYSWVSVSMVPGWGQAVKDWIRKFGDSAVVLDTNGKKIEVVDGDITGTLRPSAFPLTVRRGSPNPPADPIPIADEKSKQEPSNPAATSPPTSSTLTGPCLKTPSPRGQVYMYISMVGHMIFLIYTFPGPQACSHLWRLPRSFLRRLEINSFIL